MRRKINANLHKKLIEEVGRCELCGSRRGLEVHHIVPHVIAIHGVDFDCEDNLLVVCSNCHSRLTPRKFLTSIGVRKASNYDKLNVAFYRQVGEQIEKGNVSAVDVMDAFDTVMNEFMGAGV